MCLTDIKLLLPKFFCIYLSVKCGYSIFVISVFASLPQRLTDMKGGRGERIGIAMIMNFIALYCPYRFFGTQKNASPVWGEATLLQTERFSAAFIIKVKAGGGKGRQAAASHTAADKPSAGTRLRRWRNKKRPVGRFVFVLLNRCGCRGFCAGLCALFCIRGSA